jgi:hypothetical protein
MQRASNGISMKCQRPSRITTGSLIHLTSKEMVDQQMLDALQPIQDGGKSSDTQTDLYKTKRARYWISLETLMPRIETSLFTPNMEESTNFGTSSMSTNGRESQEKENSTKTSVFMLIEHSTLSQHLSLEDILT